jgi:uncharacterized membrane protein YqjE
MNDSRYSVHPERPLAQILTEFFDELKDFAQTRVEMFQSELRETVESAKLWLPLTVVAITLLGTAYLLFTLALVGLVSTAFVNSPYRWFLSFLSVALVWAITGAIFAFAAASRFKAKGTFPMKTAEVLKADKVWLQNEARSQL